MAKSNTEKKVLPLLEPIVAERGLELVDLEFVKEGANWYLRVYIDKEGGVSIDDCEAVSRALEAKLDEKDPIEQAYVLARENEIKTVRIILSGKQNGFSEESIRERVREMYV